MTALTKTCDALEEAIANPTLPELYKNYLNLLIKHGEMILIVGKNTPCIEVERQRFNTLKGKVP